MTRQPGQHLARMTIRRENWIEDLLYKPFSITRVRRFKSCIPFASKVGRRVLYRETEEITNTESFQLSKMIPKGACFGGASPRSGDKVPPVGIFNLRHAGSRIGIDNNCIWQRRKVDC